MVGAAVDSTVAQWRKLDWAPTFHCQYYYRPSQILTNGLITITHQIDTIWHFETRSSGFFSKMAKDRKMYSN